MNWFEIQFEDFVTLQRGFDLPKAKMMAGDVPVLGSNSIIGHHNEAKVKPPGVVTGRSGTLGIVQYIDVAYWPHNTALWVKDYHGNYPRFVYYKLQTLHLENFNGGVSVPTLNRNVLDTIPVRIPPFVEQERVSSILTAYDNLIENNRRRIQLLELAARLLYKEWFVHLRYPGHEHVKIIDGIPEGWTKGCVGDIAEVKSGYAFKSKDWQKDGNPVIKIKNINSDGSINLSDTDCVNDNIANQASTFIIEDGALLIAMTGATVGKVGIMPNHSGKYYLNQRVGQFKTKDIPEIERFLFPFYQGCFAKTQVLNFAAGAAQPNISGSQIETIEILIPEDTILNLYLELTKAFYNQCQVITEQNQKLSQTRDLLLPRLMNGEIIV